ncbi:MAG: hypothetical protein WCO57_09335 [Verrucomicrobiota bacterium]
MKLLHHLRSARLLALSVIAASLVLPLAIGQDSPEKKPSSKEALRNSKTVSTGENMIRPNPYDKFIALDSALGAETIKWKEVMNRTEVNIDPDTVKDTKVAIPALLGFRICDGVMAIKARDAEKLNACADHIEKLGKKLGVTDADLRRAKMVRSFATRGEWGRVFLELGYLQQDIEAVLQRESGASGKAPVRKILYAAGWLQGARYTSSLVRDHYNERTGGLLREPLLVKELKADLDGTGLPNTGIVKLLSDSMTELEKLVNVELRKALSKDSVEAMAKLTAQTVVACVKEAK